MSFFQGLSRDNQRCVKTDTPLEISLNDCLACSGCVTADEAESLAGDLSFTKDLGPRTSFVLSPQSKTNMFNIHRKSGMSYREFEAALSAFLRSKFDVGRIVDTSYMRTRVYEEIHKEYLATDHLVVSACPGVVTYVERTAPHLIGYLSRVKSPQQMAFALVKGARTVSVMPCHDKKLENGRDGVGFDFVLTTREFHRAINGLGFEAFIGAGPRTPHEMDVSEMTQWNIGTSAGGYAESVVGRYALEETRDVRAGVREHLLSDGSVISQITGLENSINYFKSSKAKGPRYRMADVFLCKGSCIGGPGQERVNDVSADALEYDANGREQPAVEHTDSELGLKRSFKHVRVKRVDFKVDW